jgi:hypothetical protein
MRTRNINARDEESELSNTTLGYVTISPLWLLWYVTRTEQAVVHPVTRKTKELDHEKLVTVILVPLSDRHWLYLYMEIVARRTCRTKATDTDLYIFISDLKHVFDCCSVEQTDHSVEPRLSLAYRGDLS